MLFFKRFAFYAANSQTRKLANSQTRKLANSPIKVSDSPLFEVASANVEANDTLFASAWAVIATNLYHKTKQRVVEIVQLGTDNPALFS